MTEQLQAALNNTENTLNEYWNDNKASGMEKMSLNIVKDALLDNEVEVIYVEKSLNIIYYLLASYCEDYISSDTEMQEVIGKDFELIQDTLVEKLDMKISF